MRLVEVALGAGSDASYLVDYAEDIDPAWLEGVTTVGVTSGASVPEILVRGVLERLADYGFGTVQPVTTANETLVFALPREIRPATDVRRRTARNPCPACGGAAAWCGSRYAIRRRRRRRGSAPATPDGVTRNQWAWGCGARRWRDEVRTGRSRTGDAAAPDARTGRADPAAAGGRIARTVRADRRAAACAVTAARGVHARGAGEARAAPTGLWLAGRHGGPWPTWAADDRLDDLGLRRTCVP